ncbi:MAG: alanine racemase [Candidatus Magasanikbacteria bacterium CG10_big_fil_rev_8_21_14_0_10_40_10]|uniref:Alanine racemase n=1 Tax=Candidatus Magasanikbacteria bacterium CG10_big_fil_rev_8_21_14_0_10_40_10 TaxID=1974648 RepID=A0A2M6W553_9BACT|nr:MAG: alanine racemase [Candidatus Magasanikbacteria bacterium CG10_big_fil_rev_8_21_14_0_10_40_10]
MNAWVEIDSKAIKYNLAQLKKMIGPKTMLMPVLKANAYGHGIMPMAKLCESNPAVSRICVVNSQEALYLTNAGFKKPIIILSWFDFDPKIALKLAKKSLIWPLFTLKQAKFLNQIGDKAKTKLKVHLKIDIGASRVGILPNQITEFVGKIKKMKHIHIEGVYSHFSSSEENREVTEEQLNIFQQAVKKLNENGLKPVMRHVSCSAAGILYQTARLDGYRPGIAVYGLHPSNLTKSKINLKPALSWHTKIIQIKRLPTGTKIGYDQTYTLKRPTVLAVLPIGYADGFDRRLSNQGEVLVNGKRCPVLGKVCMNLTMIDVTNCWSAREGDKATLIGKQKNLIITADDMAKWCQTINYEIVERINPQLERIYK